MTKHLVNLTWSAGPTGGGWSNPVAIPFDYSVTLAVTVTVTGTPTGGAILQPAISFDGTTYLGFNPIVVGLSAVTWVYLIDIPDAAQYVQVYHTPQTGGGASSIAAQLGSLQG